MIGKCNFCNSFKLNLEEHDITTSPGGGETFRICKKCLLDGKLPKSFKERYGISSGYTSGSTFVKFVGTAHITDCTYGSNAYGSVLAEYDDGSKLGVMCGHGGSAWLCLECAKQCLISNNQGRLF